MRRLLVLLLLTANVAMADDNSLSGVWRNPQAEAQDSTIILSQQNYRVVGTAHARWNGASAVWHGDGRLRGDKLRLQIVYTLNPNQWQPQVTLDLQRSENGRVLAGTWRNKRGESGPLRFEKVAP